MGFPTPEDLVEYAVIVLVIGPPMFLLSVWLSNVLEDRFGP